MKKVTLSLAVFLLVSCSSSNTDPAEYFDDEIAVNLLKAAVYGNGELFSDMLAKIDDINKLGKAKMTPLQWLVFRNSEETGWAIRELLVAGANPHLVTDVSRYSAFMRAARNSNIYILKEFLNFGVDPNFIYKNLSSEPVAIFGAIRAHDVLKIELLINNGAELEIRNSRQQTPLLFASTNNWEVAYTLLLAGADYTARDDLDDTMLWALENNRYGIRSSSIDWRAKVVDFLRARGVEVNLWEEDSKP